MIPISGKHKKWVPARQFMFTHLIRWMRDFHIDGTRAAWQSVSRAQRPFLTTGRL
jgi:hypothetical protein